MTPEQQAKHDAEHDCDDPMVYRATWAQFHTAKDIPAQIASWRREAAAMPTHGPDGRRDMVRRCMHALADQMEYLWNRETVERAKAFANGVLAGEYYAAFLKRALNPWSSARYPTRTVIEEVIVLVSVYDINRWFVAFGVGLLIMSLAIYIERSREQLRTRARELSETLEKWE